MAGQIIWAPSRNNDLMPMVLMLLIMNGGNNCCNVLE